jgi:NAD+ kinase
VGAEGCGFAEVEVGGDEDFFMVVDDEGAIGEQLDFVSFYQHGGRVSEGCCVLLGISQDGKEVSCQDGKRNAGCAVMKVGILLNPEKSFGVKTLKILREELEKRGCSCVLEKETAAMMGEFSDVVADAMGDHVDLVAVLGGDGTMMHAVKRLGVFEKPVAGINIGTLGFLTTCKDSEIEAFSEAVATGNFRTSPRMLLEAQVLRSSGEVLTYHGLNEVTMDRGASGRMVTLVVKVDGEMLNRYRADGLIIATPTGSTAYSLSAGGPLIAPHSSVMLITPICPHSLGQRSLVISDDVEIEISPERADDGAVIFTVDGRDTTRIELRDRVIVRKSKRSFHLLRLEGTSFYGALRQKLGWQGV